MQRPKILTFKISNLKQKYEKRRKDYSNKHTTNLVLDERTRLSLHNLYEKGKISEIESLINTGKEASVFRSGEFALKVFATSSMVFKNRQMYIDGDRRFSQLSSSSSNSRQLVKLWAEKEFRNLKRIYESGLILSPEPVLVQENVLVMRMIELTYRLSDVAKYLSEQRLEKIYYSVIRSMRDLYQKCGLVHGDLSEYNLLYKTDTQGLYFIDVGQALDNTNPNALILLKADIRNLNVFFARMNIKVVSNVQIFDFITDQFEEGADSDVVDCCSRGAYTPAEVVNRLRLLRKSAKTVDYQEAQRDDGFVMTRILTAFTSVEDANGAAQVREMAVTRVKRANKVPKERKERILILPGSSDIAEGEGEECEEEEDENTEIDLGTLKREDYTKEQWIEISKMLKQQKRISRATEKKPKNQKEKERKVARKKHGGK